MNKAIIFDRDGVLNYTVQRENEATAPWTLKEFKMIPGSIEAVEMAKELGYLALVATNQPDVRDKKMKEEELDESWKEEDEAVVDPTADAHTPPEDAMKHSMAMQKTGDDKPTAPAVNPMGKEEDEQVDAMKGQKVHGFAVPEEMKGHEEGEGEEDSEDMEDMGDMGDMEDMDGAEEGADKITDLTVDELKAIIHDIISAEMGAGEAEEQGGEPGAENIDVNLDEEEELEEEFDLEELLAELDAMGDDKELEEAKKKSKHEKGETKKEEEEEHKSGKEKKEKSEMKEALDTIETLRSELNEVNLLNAKLLYVNKIFKAKNLNESQKLKVIAQFDKATTAKEAKAIFESMSGAIEKSKKSTIKESIGFASKAAGIAPKKQIVEVNDTVSRWQMLAGITKF